jgi:hypothetical protein
LPYPYLYTHTEYDHVAAGSLSQVLYVQCVCISAVCTLHMNTYLNLCLWPGLFPGVVHAHKNTHIRAHRYTLTHAPHTHTHTHTRAHMQLVLHCGQLSTHAGIASGDALHLAWELLASTPLLNIAASTSLVERLTGVRVCLRKCVCVCECVCVCACVYVCTHLYLHMCA